MKVCFSKTVLSFSILFMFFVLNSFSLEDPFVPGFPKKEEPPVVNQNNNVNEKQSIQIHDGKIYAEESEEVKEEAIKPELQLEGIFWGADNGVVVIDDKVYYEGDKYDECKLGKIVNGKLFLICGDKVWKYSIKEELSI